MPGVHRLADAHATDVRVSCQDVLEGSNRLADDEGSIRSE